MTYPSAYIDFLVHFHGDRDYFECHEILEDYWKKVDKANKHSIWVGFILLAVANYHYRRNNLTGAIRTLKKASFILAKDDLQLEKLGLNSNALRKMLSNQLANMKTNIPYKSLQLPLIDATLARMCKQRALDKGFVWGATSDLAEKSIIHRHTLRDRSDVIKEREQQLLKKKRKY